MRTDVTIDKRQILCRNASLIGLGQRYARRGALIHYQEGARYDSGIARVLGAVSGSSEGGWINRHILAMVLSANGTHAYERWINPADVLSIRNLSAGGGDQLAFAAFFFGTLPEPDICRYLMECGTVSAVHIHNKDARIKEFEGRQS